MNKRKRLMIDKQFQLKTTFSIISIVFIVVGMVIIIIGTNFFFSNKKLSTIKEKQQEFIVAENRIFKTLLTLSTPEKRIIKNKAIIEKLGQDHEKNVIMMNHTIKIIQKITENNTIVLLVITVFGIILIVLLYILLLKKTHRIYGPIYVVSEYFKEIIEGKYSDIRALRKKDEFNNFYNLFIEMVNTIKEREEKKSM